MAMVKHFVAGCAVVLVLASSGSVDAATPEEMDQARAHVGVGKRSYNLGEFETALKEYKEAYRLTEEPSLLFNIGQCQWKLGDDKNALHSYRAYLRSAPDPANRAQVEARIAELEKKMKEAEHAAADQAAMDQAAQRAAAERAAAERAQQDAAAGPAAAEKSPQQTPVSPVVEAPKPAAPPSHARRNSGLVIGAAGVVALGVGTYFGLRAIDRADAGDHDGFDTAAWGADIGIGAGLVGVGVAAYLLLTPPRESAAASSVASRLGFSPVIGSGIGGLLMEGTW